MKLYFFLISSFMLPIHAEYIVFKKVKGMAEPITNEQEYEKVYSILMNYQWPMVCANFS